jgi:2-polyprenyl-6-methoxyphenol hydroxylase-like FAD-dependent oxidoreductase
MMLGLLLARAGASVTVLEKHSDFLRDFRGDTVHPSTLEVMHELGLLGELLARPHDKAQRIRLALGGRYYTVADFSRLRLRCGYIVMMPQWDFLDLLARAAQRHPAFSLRMQAEATGLLRSADGSVAGVRIKTPQGDMTLDADLVIGADGRHSIMRAAAGMKVRDLGAPIDVLWMRLPMAPGDPTESMGRIARAQFLAMIRRSGYWQCAYLIPKGGIDALRRQGLAPFRQQLAQIAPMFADRVHLLASWDDIKLLSVAVDRLEQWHRPGLLCIGDAAHAMSPVGGVGINLAIQDAVATARILGAPLADVRIDAARLTPLLEQVQRRRLWPTRITQAAQLAIHRRILTPVLRQQGPLSAPWVLRLLDRWPVLQALPAYAIGVGARPEHVKPD